MYFNKTPWSNMHGFNLDWVIKTVKECLAIVESYQQIDENVALNSEITTLRKLSETGNFTGTWQGETYQDLNERLINMDLLGTWNGETKQSLDNRLTFGDFLGTWNGETKNSLDGRIEDGALLYADVITLINSNPELNLEIIDGGYLASIIVPDIEDLGLVTEPVTEEIDCGFIIYPCACI